MQKAATSHIDFVSEDDDWDYLHTKFLQTLWDARFCRRKPTIFFFDLKYREEVCIEVSTSDRREG